ncbi:hypothetical protein AURDEDRAFT_61105 [Auricularia subglabra TFB-10046 SS5]|nr:hypothetical protein AURDEDRAFT_61105 [Auricularia subglabra TFB-10046 SS5]
MRTYVRGTRLVPRSLIFVQACSWNVLRYLRRAALSRKQLELARWHAEFNGARDLPTERQMQRIDKQLQDACGIATIPYIGAMGNRFSVNSLADMLAQEVANPRVRPHLRDLPEDAQGGPRSESWQFQQWMERMPAEFATPMVRLGGSENFQDFYVFEPALLHLRAAYETIEVPATDFTTAFPSLKLSYQMHGIPDPCEILGSLLSPDGASGGVHPWLRTNPQVGNRWRALSGGKKVRSVPFWLYCDDTSGNQSKKWNKHNSFLFALSGLPREQAQLEYNIHFLTTSNTAATTEMLDAVVDQIEEGQQTGIWAYDCEEKDTVLLIPFALALLGDNPMQSEFACHIGLRGRHFCRTCWVQGKTSETDTDDLPAHERERGDASGNDSTASASAASAVKKKRPLETMSTMLQRVQDFVKRKTEFGTKDTFLEFFVNKLFQAIKGKRAGPARTAAAEACKSTFPPQQTSPIWRLEGLDPHQDTPVEVLHVVLLGIIKYFWRDVVNNQCKSPEARAELIARLNSFDTTGLGIPPLRGETLVQYAGSLVGRDFRTIVQAAPFVLHGIVDNRCFRAWTALADLVPLIWQPVIDDLEEYLTRLTAAINNLLASTASWTPQWFNKPKFHILVHLPDHIRRFGPAILFATEGFESFNAVIRSKSLHSNRQAPSRDIALAFAQGDRVRHLLSGGFFLWRPRNVQAREGDTAALREIDLRVAKALRRRAYTAVQPDPCDFVCTGRGVVSLPLLNDIVAKHLGLSPLLEKQRVPRLGQ